ncbi:hypothetical protein CHUAL_002853 [Chamberlinius hualienensis]
MAALLKKRALAEFSQVIQEEAPKQSKRLRLIKKPKPVTWNIDLSCIGRSGTTPSESLQALLQLADFMPHQAEDAARIYKELKEQLAKEKDSLVRSKMVQLLGELCLLGEQDVGELMDELAGFIQEETSRKVILQILETFYRVVKRRTLDSKFDYKLINLAKQVLIEGNHLVKCKCLEILGDITPIDATEEIITSTLKLLGSVSNNYDPRVRAASLNSMLRFYERGVKIDMSTYGDVTKMLNEDYEGVRIAALKLIVVISQAFADSVVTLKESDEHVRLIDDAFGKVCNAINDLSLPVRIQAAQLLGKMTNVSLKFMEQTLDKRLMSNMKRKCSAHERQKESFESGEWASGQKWADDAPREAIDADDITLIATGACGAVVHGLEDEFMEVRSATLDSLCNLALQSPTFASLTIDFLVDMLNDEIEDVRLKAIHCLTKFCHIIVLRADQLEIILAGLEDFSMEIREGLHGMLSSCQLSTKSCLKMCVDNLLENLKRYPQDKRSIWRCLKNVGSRHAELTLPLVTELLGIHPYFDTPEPDMDDPAYVSVLILILNAAKNYPTMVPLFEQYTRRHYNYLRDSIPHLVPHITFLGRGESQLEIPQVLSQTTEFLQNVLERVAKAEMQTTSTRQLLQEAAIQDLDRIAQIEPNLAATANCASLYIKCQCYFAKILHNKNWCNSSVLALQGNTFVKNAVEQLSQTSFKLAHMFNGFNSSELAMILQMRLKVFALHLVYIVRGSNSSALALCEYFLSQVEKLQKFLWTNNLNPDSFVDAVFCEMGQLEDPKPGMVARILQPLLQSYRSPPLRLISQIHQAKATIYEPTGESDTPLKFTSGLVLGVNLDAEIENVEDLKTVRIKVKYPDQQTQLILIRLSDFRPIEERRCRLMTTALLSHNLWSGKRLRFNND